MGANNKKDKGGLCLWHKLDTERNRINHKRKLEQRGRYY